jgi:solute:Na+ symporter, SSS family
LKRMNAKGAFWSMLVGFAVGLFRMAVDTPVTLGLPGFESGYPNGSFLWIVNQMYFQYYSVLIAIVSAIVMVAVSYATDEPDYSKLKSVTFATVTPEEKARTRASWTWREVLGSALVLACIIASYLYFRG